MRENIRDRTAPVVVLDTPAQSTSGVLSGDFTNIIIPNHEEYVSVRTCVCAACVALSFIAAVFILLQISEPLAGVTYKPISLMDLFWSWNSKPFSAVIADYCGKWCGNQQTGADPKDDLDLLFSKDLLCRVGGVLSVTVCLRGKTKEEHEIVSEICTIARRYRYQLEEVARKTYYTSIRMLWLLFVTKK